MIVPVFAIAGQHYEGATPALLGLAVGIYGLTQAIFQLPYSWWADHKPRKPLIILGLFLFALGGAIAAMSDSIWGVIIGRAIAGSGAVSAVVMALLADVTREEQRTKAMAVMGMSIGLSFMVAFSTGPWLSSLLGISGLFWLTSVMGILAMLLLLLVPHVQVQHKSRQDDYREKLRAVLKNANLNRLHLSIFMLHLLMTALFIFLPKQLVDWANIPVNHHGWVYMPLLLLSLFFAVPSIIVAEKKRQMRHIFISAVFTLLAGLLLLTLFHQNAWGLLLGLALFFIAFNVVEALLPSWLSKIAPANLKATAMGINASSQFLGAFAGGVLGGQLLAFNNYFAAWAILAGVGVIWLITSWFMDSPRYLSTLTVKLPLQHDMAAWSEQLLTVNGVEEVVILRDQQMAYLKVDTQVLGDVERQKLSQMSAEIVAF